MTLPVSLILLGVIALVLHILFGYVLTAPAPPRAPYFRQVVAVIVIIVVLLLWFVLPVRVG